MADTVQMPPAAGTETGNPLVMSVIRHKLRSATEEMVETMVRTCFSPILNQNQDFSAVVLDADFQTVVQAERVPIHMGAMPIAVRRMAERFAGDIHEGDVFCANDPYWGGSHLPDVTLAAPCFEAGEIRFWAAIRAHQGDIGGMSAGGYSGAAREIWHEGLRIPPVRLVAQGVLRDDVLGLLAENSRQPRDLTGDVLAQLSAVGIGRQRVSELYGRYGSAEIAAAVTAILDGGERLARQLIDSCRPGCHTGESGMEFAPAPGGVLPLRVSVTVTPGERMIVDLTECPDQVQAFINSPFANTRAAVIVAFLYFSGAEDSLNDGSARAIEIRTRKGSLCDPVLPAPVGACTSSTACAIIEATLRALEGADPDRAIGGFARRFRFAMAGEDADGAPFIWHHFLNKGGAGASRGCDGWPNIGGLHNPGGTPAPSVERTEAAYPITVEEYALLPDSGGAGSSRGGLGGRLVLRYDGAAPAVLNASGEGVMVLPFGTSGGADGYGHDYRIEAPDGAEWPIGVHEAGLALEPGNRIVCLSAGGGGWGDPAQRDRDLVRSDLANGYISAEAARRVYGLEDGPDGTA